MTLLQQRKILCMILLILNSVISVWAQSDTLWTKVYGGANADAANALIALDDGGFLMAGYTFNETADAYLIKTDQNGSQEWAQSIDDGGDEYVNDVCKSIGNDGYVAVGNAIRPDGNGWDAWVARTDPNGNMLWTQHLGGAGLDMAEAVCTTTDNAYLVCGTAASGTREENDIYLIKIDDQGDTLWTKTIGCERSDTGRDIIRTSNDAYLICGSTGLYDAPYPGSSGRNREIYLVKIDADGNILTENSFWIMNTHQNSYDEGFQVIETENGDFCVVGSTSQHLNELMDVAVLRVNAQLELVWKNHFEMDGFYDFGYAIAEESGSGNLFVTGSARNADTRTTQLFWLTLTSNGEVLNSQLFRGTNNECGKAIVINNNTGTVAGFTSSAANGGQDAWLIHFHELVAAENASIMMEDQDLISHVESYPNPFNPETTLVFTLARQAQIEVAVYNVKGQRVKPLHLGILAAGEHHFQWNGNNADGEAVASGMYFIQICSGDTLVLKKKILLK